MTGRWIWEMQTNETLRAGNKLMGWTQRLKVWFQKCKTKGEIFECFGLCKIFPRQVLKPWLSLTRKKYIRKIFIRNNTSLQRCARNHLISLNTITITETFISQKSSSIAIKHYLYTEDNQNSFIKYIYSSKIKN